MELSRPLFVYAEIAKYHVPVERLGTTYVTVLGLGTSIVLVSDPALVP
jgi:hypothetical protein